MLYAIRMYKRSFFVLRAPLLFLIVLVCSEPGLAAQCSLGVMADLPVKMEGLRASVPTKINGQETNFWLDSGAFFSIMSKSKAIELGLSVQAAPPGFRILGIGGSASVEVATVKSFGLVGQDLKNVDFLVGGSDAGNALIGSNLLGMADTEFDLANGSVKLINSRGCEKASLAYWTAGKPFFSVALNADPNPRIHSFRLPVLINGVKIEAELDTGAPRSLLSRRAAERAGIDLSAPGTTALNGLSGFGRRQEKGWVVKADSVAVGDEEILHPKLEVIDNSISRGNAPDMLLGADFIMAHHIYVARAQRKIYFTYTGGRPFKTESSLASEEKSSPTSIPEGKMAVEAVNVAADPKTAEEFARRGKFRLSTRNLPSAIADLSEAIRLSPDNAEYYADRAKAYRVNGEGDRCGADLDHALKIDPKNAAILRERSSWRLQHNDKTGALADVEAASHVTPASSLESAEIAVLFARLGYPTRAIPLYDAVIVNHPYDSKLGGLLNGRCWVRALANLDLGKALEDCNRAIKLDGVKASFLDSRGLVNLRKGDLKAAIADYDSALKLNSKLTWSLYGRSLAKNALGQIEGAKADKASAEAIDPEIAVEAARYGIGS